MKIKTLMNEDLNKQLQEEFKNLIFNYVSVKNFKGRHKTNIACVSTRRDYHGVCGSFFSVSISLSRGIAANISGDD